MNNEVLENNVIDMPDIEAEKAAEILKNNYRRYVELGKTVGLRDTIDQEHYESALERAKNWTAPNKARITEAEKIDRIKQAEEFALTAGIQLHNTPDALDQRTILYEILRSDIQPQGVKYHHQQMGDHLIFAEALRMLEDVDALNQLIERYPNIASKHDKGYAKAA